MQTNAVGIPAHVGWRLGILSKQCPGSVIKQFTAPQKHKKPAARNMFNATLSMLNTGPRVRKRPAMRQQSVFSCVHKIKDMQAPEQLAKEFEGSRKRMSYNEDLAFINEEAQLLREDLLPLSDVFVLGLRCAGTVGVVYTLSNSSN